MRVLLVEDEWRLAVGLRRCLEAEGHSVDVARDGVQGLRTAREHGHDVIVLEILLLRLGGLEVRRALRSEGDRTPILLLTAPDGERDAVRALDAGTDDYLTKPFSYALLLTRVRALLRRSGQDPPAALAVGDLVVDPVTRRVTRAGTEVVLTARELSVLEHLARRAGEVVPKRDVLEHVWDYDFRGDQNVVEVHVGHLRNKVDRPFGRHSIETVRGIGYRLVADPPQQAPCGQDRAPGPRHGSSPPAAATARAPRAAVPVVLPAAARGSGRL